MNKKLKKSLLVSLLVLSMVFSNVGAFAISTSLQAMQEGEKYGTQFGELDGKLAADKDAGQNLKSLSSRHRPTQNEVVITYKLDYDDANYKNAFIKHYFLSYDLSYQSNYRLNTVNRLIEPMDSGTEDGKSLGEIQGSINAVLDFTKNYDSDWEKSYKRFVYESSLTARYYLDRDKTSYKEAFENAFKENYRLTYTQAFHERNLTVEKLNINLYNLQNEGSDIEFNKDIFEVDNAEVKNESKKVLSLSVPKGTVYKEVPLQIYKMQHSEHLQKVYENIEPVSEAFTIAVANTGGYTILNEDIDLSFTYHGSEYAGIYLWHNDRWEYQYTSFEEGKITSKIPAGHYSGGTYAIFVDSSARHLNQSSYHWARKETYTFMRRNIIGLDVITKLDSPVTRGAFAEMLYRALGDDLSTNSYPFYSDFDQLGESKVAIDYLVASRYMFKDKDDAFKADAYLSYQDLEKLFENIHFRNFAWEEIATTLLHDKYIKSQGLIDTGAQVPLGEVIYALHNYLK